MNLLKFAIDIQSKLQQNSWTAFFPDETILTAINDALNYVYTYADWSWCVVREDFDETTPTDFFKLQYKLYRVYGARLDKKKYERANLDTLDIDAKGRLKFFAKDKSIKYWTQGSDATIFYHRGAPSYDRIDGKYTIDIPEDMILTLKLCVMWLLHPGGFEQWAQLAMTYFEMMKEDLDRRKKIDGFLLNPDDIKLDSIYN